MSAEPGSRLVEELRLLADAVADRAGPWLDGVAAHPAADGSSSEGPSSCGWCPLCAAVAVVRGEPNELAERGLDAAADLVALLRAVLADRWEPGVAHMPGFTPSSRRSSSQSARSAQSSQSARSSKVRHIPVRREPR